MTKEKALAKKRAYMRAAKLDKRTNSSFRKNDVSRALYWRNVAKLLGN